MIFENIKDVALPDGTVKQISYGNINLWSKNSGTPEEQGLPIEYQEVDWICGNGGYINTGYVPTQNTSATLEYDVTAQHNTATYFGILTGSMLRAEIRYKTRWYAYCASTVWSNPSAMSDTGNTPNILYNMTLRSTEFTINSATVTNSNTGSGSTTLPVYLFAGNNNGTADEIAGYLRVYSFKLYENDVVSCDLVPCYRKADGVIGMYDIIGRHFYANAGSNTFLKGNDVS